MNIAYNICNKRGIPCYNASNTGVCQSTACPYSYTSIVKFGYDSEPVSAPITMPDELIINGIKYRKVEEHANIHNH